MKRWLAAILIMTVLPCVPGRWGVRADEARAPEHSPEGLVQCQVEAYNRHDLEGFSATYADDVRIYSVRGAFIETAISGKAQLRQFYQQQRFNRPQLRAQIVQRSTLGAKVIDRELITGLADKPVEAVVVYAIEGQRIVAAWIFST